MESSHDRAGGRFGMRQRGLKPESTLRGLRGAEAPLFHVTRSVSVIFRHAASTIFVRAVMMIALLLSVAEIRAGDSASKSIPPAFYKDVLPILQKHCQSCHRSGEPAPMPLMTYAEARKYS